MTEKPDDPSGERSPTASKTPLSAGARLGPYEILELLGAGGMGEVYRARDERLQRDVAIKVLPALFAQDSDRVRRFEREARAVAGLSHPNIMAIHDVGLHDGVPYLIAELLEGETLRSRLDKGALPVRKAIDYAIHIAHGLTAAHEKGIVHRDLKPANLFLTKDGRVKILDFGLAKATRPESPGGPLSAAPTAPQDTEAGMVLGTAGYMSPEQVLGQPVEERSDLFSFGTVLYEMLTGHHAFARRTSVETMSAILNEDPPELLASRAEIPPALTRIVFHCLEKDPQQRFQSARDLVFALEALSPASGERLAAPALSKTPRRAAILVLAALLVGAGLFWTGTRLHRKESGVTFRRITFRRGNVTAARFTPDGESIVYSASYDGNPMEVFLTRVDGHDSRPLGLSAMQLLSVSRTGELALSKKDTYWQATFGGTGTLVRMPLTGVGSPRELIADTWSADWGPGGELAVVRSVDKAENIEYPIGHVILRDAGMTPFKLRVSPRGDRLAFMALGAGHDPEIRVTDLQGHMTTIATSLGVGNPVWSPDGSEVFFSADESLGNSAIWAATMRGRRRTVMANTQELEMQDISKDGRVLVNDQIERTALVFGDVKTGRERDLSWLDGSSLVDLSEDAGYVLFRENSSGQSPKGDIFLRKTDGSAPVRLGDGIPRAISPDRRWVLALTRDTPRKLVLHPTGTGEPRTLSFSGLEPKSASFSPDSRRIAVIGNKEGKTRVFLTDLEGHETHPFGPDDPVISFANRVVFSPDGKNAVLRSEESGSQIWPVDGGASTGLPGITRGETVIQWSVDQRFLYVVQDTLSIARVDRFEIATGRRQLWREIVPVDRAGLLRVGVPFVSRDGQHFAYSYSAVVKSDLYLLDGLQGKLW